MKLALAAAALAALSLGAAAPVAAKSPLEPDTSTSRAPCFWTHQVNGFASSDDRIVNIRVGVRDVYQFEMFGRCEDVDFNNHIALVSRGSSYICTGTDADIISDTTIGPRRCHVKAIRKLTAEEAKALPKRARP